MPTYAVEFLPSADKALGRLPLATQRRIVRAAELLADDPRPAGALKLTAGENVWRIRVGDYRVLYEIHDKRLLVLVIRIGHRKDIYPSK
ncbi:MAG TPA: type II toxin-antitoxin system RelE/ParE family toxin [Pirellulales bacterium]|jgi:mRNA interferase RelE/StbE|nr:type II toxin-antitoxin system RelE/ParE family toxin [Pirellulales bacterium]